MRIGVVLLSLDVVGEDPLCPLPGVGGRFENVSVPEELEDGVLFSALRRWVPLVLSFLSSSSFRVLLGLAFLLAPRLSLSGVLDLRGLAR